VKSILGDSVFARFTNGAKRQTAEYYFRKQLAAELPRFPSRCQYDAKWERVVELYWEDVKKIHFDQCDGSWWTKIRFAIGRNGKTEYECYQEVIKEKLDLDLAYSG
jgi:hypothetical protein